LQGKDDDDDEEEEEQGFTIFTTRISASGTDGRTDGWTDGRIETNERKSI